MHRPKKVKRSVSMRQYPLAATFSLLLLPLTWTFASMAHSLDHGIARDGISHAAKDKQKANDASRRRAQETTKRKTQEAARRKAQQDAARRKAQEAARRKAQQDVARRKAQEAARRKVQQDAARRKTQEAARRKVQQDAARHKVQKEAFKREPVAKTSGHRPAKMNPQPIPFRPGTQQHTEQISPFSNKGNTAIHRPSRGSERNPTSVKPGRKSMAGLEPKPSTNTNEFPWFLSNPPIKNDPTSLPNSDNATTVCWWEPAPSPVIDIDVHLGLGSHCWTPMDHHHWWFGGGWHWHHHASTCHSFGWGFLCWSRPGCHTLGWRPWWDRPNCVEWWTPTWNWCSPSVHYITLAPPPPPSSQQCWDALNYGDLGLARRDFLKRLAADPFDADSRLGLALCEGLRGNTSGLQAELLRVLEDDPWVCLSWRPGSLRDQLKGLLRDASRDARRVDVPERWVVVGALAVVAQEDGVALAGLHRALAHQRSVPGAELLHQLVQDRQLAF